MRSPRELAVSGCIDIDKNTSWMVATWAFDLALRGISEHLDAEANPFIAGLIQKAMPPRIRLLSLDEAPVAELPGFLAALRRAREEVAGGGGPTWDSPDARDSFLLALDELATKVDARLRSGA